MISTCVCNLRWLHTVFFLKMEITSVFLENYYQFKDKEYFYYVKHLKSSNSFTKVAQLPLL